MIAESKRQTADLAVEPATVAAVEVSGLTKVFPIGRWPLWQRVRRQPDPRRRLRAVDGIDLRIERGEIFGLLGPNGAGKTTTMRMLATLLEPSAGEVRIFGRDVMREPQRVRARLGTVLSGERSLYWKLTARENLEYFAALYHVPARETRQRIQQALETVQLADRADDYVERYSTGMRQRLVLARALLPAPDLLLIDEPTVGLDPQSAAHLRERILRLREQDTTILISTHYMEEADQLCDRLAIIDHGKIVALGTPAELKRTIRTDQVVRLRLPADRPIEPFLQAVQAIATVARSRQLDGHHELTLHCSAAPELVTLAFEVAHANRTAIEHVEVVPITLEEVFLSLTGRELRE